MNLAVVPSLEKVALQNVVVALWNEDDIKKILSETYILINRNDRLTVFNGTVQIVNKKALNLPIPEQLKLELTSLVRPIGFQLYTWIDYHIHSCDFVKSSPTLFHFTPHGTVDNKAMAEMLMQDPTINVVNRFRLACTYCLVPHIHALWEQLPDECREELQHIENKGSRLISFWAHCLAGKTNQLNEVIQSFCGSDGGTLYEYAFLAAAVSGNSTSTEYFLQKLTLEEKERTLFKTAVYITKRHSISYVKAAVIPKSYYTDVLCFLLSTMNEEQQILLFSDQPYHTLMCLLDWPWGTRFLELLERMHAFLIPKDYYYLLEKINDKVMHGYEDQNYQKLFTTVWRQIPVDCKDSVMDACTNGPQLLQFLNVKENAMLILEEASEGKKMEILLGRGQNMCRFLVYNNLWEKFQLFLQMCATSREMLLVFKSNFRDHLLDFYPNRGEDVRWERAFEICDEFIRGYEIRQMANDKSIVEFKRNIW